MADAQYPNNGVQRKIFPTTPGFITTGWEPAKGHREEEEIENESGILSNIVGVDLRESVTWDAVVQPNSNVPNSLTVLTFSNGTAGNGNYLIRGDVTIVGNAGRAKRIRATLFKNEAMPA